MDENIKKNIIKTISYVVMIFSIGLGIISQAHAGRLHTVKINGQEFQPSEFQAWPGDTLKICNQSNYRRQPYSRNKYNRFGKRTSDPTEMLKKGQCVEVPLSNPTPKILKVTVRDAIAGKAKLVINVWQKK